MNFAPRATALRSVAALVLACAALSAASQPAGDGPSSLRVAKGSAQPGIEPVIGPVIEPARGGQCVAEPALMRRQHPDLLKHQRDETVHRGVRDPRSSLKGCVECHASKATGSVAAAKTDFCISCHSFVAVKVDCFGCHASKPQATAFLPLNHPHAGSAATRLTAQWRQMGAAGVPEVKP